MFVKPAIHTWPEVIQGTMFPNVPMVIGKDLTGCTLAMAFTGSDGQVVHRVTITITDAPNGSFTLQKFKVHFPPGQYKSDLDITDADGDTNTYLQSTLPVKAQHS